MYFKQTSKNAKSLIMLPSLIKSFPTGKQLQLQIYFIQYQSMQDSPTSVPKSLTSLKSMQSDISYEQSDQQVQIPKKNAKSEAIYHKYQAKQLRNKNSIIKEQEEQNYNPSYVEPVKFTIKNLDTGQEIQIENQTQEMMISRRLSQGRDDIVSGGEASWKDFWLNVYKNNENLRQYCEDGLYDEAKNIIENGFNNYPVEIDWKGLDDWTPIHYACYEGHDDIVHLLCKNHADVNARTRFNRNGLHIAALRGHHDVVKVLVNNQIEINAFDSDGNTALHFAAENGHRDIIVFLIESGCKIKKNREGLTPIHDCCYDYLKKVFYQYGFKEDDFYEQNVDSSAYNPNRLERQIINPEDVSETDFVYFKVLGRGSFGQVYLVKRKGDESNRLFAMKVLSKSKLSTNNLKRYALTERNVLSSLNHPFMVKLVYAFQSSSKLFLVMDYYPGGDMGKLIAKKKFFSEEEAKKYICEIVLALEALHKNMIVFRDLKPDNIVFDSQGHCRLTDFGLSKQGIYNNITQSFCGSVAYLAPQILSKQGHSRTVDWYLLGVLIYQLMVGLPPYYNIKREVLYENIKRGPLKIPKTMSFEAKDVIKKLLCRDPKKRLGAIKDSQQIKQHPFFKDVDWSQVFNRKIKMPVIQQTKASLITEIQTNFNDFSPQNNTDQKIQGWTFIQRPK